MCLSLTVRHAQLLALSLLMTALSTGVVSAQTEHTIGIVREGESWYFDSFIEGFLQELNALVEDDYVVKVKDFSAGGDNQKIAEQLRAAMADPEVELIYAAGVLATERAASMPEAERTKPVMGGALQFSDVRQLGISPQGTSSIRNFTFITNPQRVASDLVLLAELTGEHTLYGLIEGRILAELQGLDAARARMEQHYGVQLEMIPATPTAAGTLANIPGGVRAMYVSILPDMPEAERVKLFEGLKQRGIRTVCMEGRGDVERGGLACLAPEKQQAIARRTALNAYQILAGVGTEALAVYLPVEDHLVINAETGQAIGWSPTYDLALRAEFINESLFDTGERMDIDEAMRLAALQNADTRAEQEDTPIAIEQMRQIRSARMPSVTLEMSHARAGFSDINNPLLTPEHAWDGSYGVELRQLLFSDELKATVKAAKLNIFVADYDALSVELDARESAALAYLDYLAAKALLEIERENLNLSQNNQQLAELRIEIGAAEPAESFRWQQDVARNRSNLFAREQSLNNALIEFNRIIGVPRMTRWSFAELELASEEYYFLDGYLDQLIVNQRQFLHFGEYIQQLAVENSPELAAFDYSLNAQGIILQQRKRSFFLPEVAAFAGYDRTLESTNRTPTDTQNETLAGIQLSYTIFEGGLRKAEVAEQEANIRQLSALRDSALQRIEQRSLVAVNGMAANHPNIRLSRMALEAAEKTYESVQEKYSQGAASILDLLDAQSSLLLQRQQEAIAVYSYLQDTYRLQRSIAWFEFTKAPAEKRAWARTFSTYLRDGEDTDLTEVVSYAPPEETQEEAADAIERTAPPVYPEIAGEEDPEVIKAVVNPEPEPVEVEDKEILTEEKSGDKDKTQPKGRARPFYKKLINRR